MLKLFLEDRAGAAAAEYILLLAIFGAGIGAGAYYLGSKEAAALVRAGDNLLAQATDTSPSAGAGTGSAGSGSAGAPAGGKGLGGAPGQNPSSGNGNSNGNQTPGAPPATPPGKSR